MGGKQSRPHPRPATPQAPLVQDQPAQEAPASQKAPTTEAKKPAPVEKVDVLITSTNCQQDLALAALIKDALESQSTSVYITEGTGEDAKVAGKLLVDSQCCVYIASKEAAENNVGQDLISLAYISNKTILVAAEEPKNALLKGFVIGMKMTLHQLEWTIFDVDPKSQIEVFVNKIMAASTEAAPTASLQPSTGTTRRGGRLNTKLRQQSTLQNLGKTHDGAFWERNFGLDDEIQWYKFQQSFLEDYESQLTALLDADNIPWILGVLKNDILEVPECDKVTKAKFMEVRGDSDDKDAFYKLVSQIAVEKFNMKEVFNMNSTVRLTAIEKLAAFQNPAVVEALMVLLEDADPNVRAVAAISLGRTGVQDESIVDKLIGLLKDGDRIVRQSACLSLGAMKAKKAIPHIGDRWRNDFISVVRNAARTALENMKIPEAQEVLSVTKVLEDEIAALEGNQAAV